MSRNRNALFVLSMIIMLCFNCGNDSTAPEVPIEPIEFLLTASDAGASEHFGRTVAISGEYILVGAKFDSDKGTESGSVYVIKRSGAIWNLEAKLTASDGEEGDFFGGAVAIDGDYAVVGAFGDDDRGANSGSAYIFKHDGTSWQQEAKITSGDASQGDSWGRRVAICGHYVVVGAPRDDDSGTNSGSAYIFKKDGTSWKQEAKLTANDATALDEFGISVAINEDRAVIGASQAGGYGAAYVFERNGTTWSQAARLTATEAPTIPGFGFSVALDNDYIIVGAYLNEVMGINSGTVYVFKQNRSTWTQEAKLTVKEPVESDFFGVSVAISGDRIAVGAEEPGPQAGPGSVYVFKVSGSKWTEEVKLAASNGRIGDWFGESVAISDDDVVVGSWAGAAYVYTLQLR